MIECPQMEKKSNKMNFLLIWSAFTAITLLSLVQNTADKRKINRKEKLFMQFAFYKSIHLWISYFEMEMCRLHAKLANSGLKFEFVSQHDVIVLIKLAQKTYPESLLPNYFSHKWLPLPPRFVVDGQTCFFDPKNPRIIGEGRSEVCSWGSLELNPRCSAI